MTRRLAIACAALLVATAALVAVPALGPGSATPTAPGSLGGEASTGSSAPGTASPMPAAASPVATPSPGPRVIPRRPPSATPHLGARLQAHLDRYREAAGMPGVSAAIEFSDGSVWLGTSGASDVGVGDPVTPDTAFSFASMTKTFVAAAVLDLVGDGLLALDDPVADLLPDIAIDRRITVHQLLDHTSGLHDFFLGRGIDAALQSDRAAAWTFDQALAYVARPYFAPGTGWRYSNTNYLLLGLAIERLTGQDLATVIRDRFLGPLGLDGTYVQGAESAPGPVARGYRFRDSSPASPAIDLSDGSPIMPFTSVVTAAGGAGSMAGTAADAARWARQLYRGDVLDAYELALMVGDIEVVGAFRPAVPYGLGVQAFTIDGRPTLGHSGRFLGFRGTMRYFVDGDVAGAVLTNQSRTDPGPLLAALVEIALPRLGVCGECPAPD